MTTTPQLIARSNRICDLIAELHEDWTINDDNGGWRTGPSPLNALFAKSSLNPHGREWTDDDLFLLVETSDDEDGRLWFTIMPSKEAAAEHSRITEYWSFWFVMSLDTGARYEVQSAHYTFAPLTEETS